MEKQTIFHSTLILITKCEYSMKFKLFFFFILHFSLMIVKIKAR